MCEPNDAVVRLFFLFGLFVYPGLYVHLAGHTNENTLMRSLANLPAGRYKKKEAF